MRAEAQLELLEAEPQEGAAARYISLENMERLFKVYKSPVMQTRSNPALRSGLFGS